jgi:hypothetical protein
MRRLASAVLLGLVGLAAPDVSAAQASIELRHTPFLVRPNHTPSLCPMLAFSLPVNLWVGGGYEFVQDYDAVLWTSETVGHKPIVMSGLRAGVWYRGGEARHGVTAAAGALFTYANPAFSMFKSPDGIDRSTSVLDLGADFSVGYVWDIFRLEVFFTPAWSVGRVASPAVQQHERLSSLTLRAGAALGVLLGS